MAKNYARGGNKFFERGSRVAIENPKHKNFGMFGTLTDMNRGNVTVKLDNGETITTRMAVLRDLNLLEKLADAANGKG
jgi:hypothetical protein